MSKTLREFSEGSIIRLKENGVLTEYYVAKHDYEPDLNGNGRTLVVRRYADKTMSWAGENANTYVNSQPDTYFNGEFKARFDADTQKAMGETTFYYTPMGGNNSVSTLRRSVFSLSLAELNQTYDQANAEGTALPSASVLKILYNTNGTAVSYWTRTPRKNETANSFYITNSGGVTYVTVGNSHSVREAFTLPSESTQLTESGDISHYVFIGISGEDGSIGDRDIPFEHEYVVSLNVAGTANVTETIDGLLQIRNYNANPDVIQTAVVSTPGLSQGDHTLTIKAEAQGASATRTLTFTLPVTYLSITDGDIGTKGEKFTIPYMTKAYSGADVTVTEYIDGKEHRSYTATSGAEQEMTVNTEFLTDTKHTAEIVATAYGETKKATLTFTVAPVKIGGGGTVQELQDYNGDPVYPATTAKAVIRNDGRSVEETFNDVENQLYGLWDATDVCVEKITASGVWKAPKSFDQKFRVFCVGGGGSGAGANSTSAGAGGGGSGYVEDIEIIIPEDEEVAIVCGAGGTASVGAGVQGGSTLFGDYLSAAGGEGGKLHNVGAAGGNGGAGGGGGGLRGGRGGDAGKYGGGGGGGYGAYSSAGGNVLDCRGGNGGEYGGGGGAGVYLSAQSTYENVEGGAGGKYGGNGGNVTGGSDRTPSPGETPSIASNVSLLDVMFRSDLILNMPVAGAKGNGGSGGGAGAKSAGGKGGSTAGGGGGGLCGNGGAADNAGGGGGGFCGNGGNTTSNCYGGGGGGGFFCNGGQGTAGGGGGGGFFSDGANAYTGTNNQYYGGKGGNGGVLIIYQRSEKE